MADLIDRQALLKHLNECINSHGIAHSPLIDAVLTAIKCDVEQMPTVEPKREEKRGEWVDKRGRIYCSVCGSAKPHFVDGDLITYWTGDYCRMCGALLKRRGADMKGESE